MVDREHEGGRVPDIRLIERWLPIAGIGIESVRERTPMTPFPGPNRRHVWWARRQLVASRAYLALGRAARVSRVPELAGGPANERVRWFEIVDAVEQQSAGRWLGGTGCVRFNKVGMHGPLYRCGKQRYCKSNKVTPTNEG